MAYEAYLKGAALNNSDSLYNLGIMQLHGLGTDRNETRGKRRTYLYDSNRVHQTTCLVQQQEVACRL